MKSIVPIAMAIAFLLAGCATLETITQIGTTVAVGTGKISPEEAESINKTTAAAAKAFESMTPEQEYYIGRAVAATILKSYRPYGDKAVNHYLTVLGQALALASDRPETFGGYHFLALDTDEINAFATPGGFIFVTRGLLRCCNHEDAVAAVLAHEIAHVQCQHGLKAIKKSRITAAVTVAAAEGAKHLGTKELAELTKTFEDSVNDVIATLVNSGYSRATEREADREAVKLLKRVGYNPSALKEMLEEMQRRMKPTDAGFARTHPEPAARIREIESLLGGAPPVTPVGRRQVRFQRALAGI
ncbi:MAG: M48 family metalloprotease [Kiritimatiellia bacterium]